MTKLNWGKENVGTKPMSKKVRDSLNKWKTETKTKSKDDNVRMIYPTYEEEWEWQQEKEKRYKEGQNLKRREHYLKKKAEKQEEENKDKCLSDLSKVIGWILYSDKAGESDSEHLVKAREAIPKDTGARQVIRNCVERFVYKNRYTYIPWDKPFTYVAYVLHNTILPELTPKGDA